MGPNYYGVDRLTRKKNLSSLTRSTHKKKNSRKAAKSKESKNAKEPPSKCNGSSLISPMHRCIVYACMKPWRSRRGKENTANISCVAVKDRWHGSPQSMCSHPVSFEFQSFKGESDLCGVQHRADHGAILIILTFGTHAARRHARCRHIPS